MNLNASPTGLCLRVTSVWFWPSGCSLLFYETYGRSGGTEQELSPRYALLTDDSIAQAVPEHPRKEHVFCLSNSHGDVYLFQVSSRRLTGCLFPSCRVRTSSVTTGGPLLETMLQRETGVSIGPKFS